MLKKTGEAEILVVDDSAVARLAVGRAIQETPGLHLGGFAANGREARQLLAFLVTSTDI